eukprot:4225175-Prymnesium_polylepis.1
MRVSFGSFSVPHITPEGYYMWHVVATQRVAVADMSQLLPRRPPSVWRLWLFAELALAWAPVRGSA